jgi:hypothetical protein
MAVGHFTSMKSGGAVTLSESWNGTAWSHVDSPNPTGILPADTVLSGISCVSPADCTAVGEYQSIGRGKTLVESWNGTSWSHVPSPNRGGQNILQSVSCVSATSCMAVGYYNKSSTVASRNLIESWNGTTWSVVSSPNPAAIGDTNQLSGVSCVSASDCTAVGYYGINGGDNTLVESWNGTAWSVVPTPSLGSSTVSTLLGVSCVSASDCTAVGAQLGAGNANQTLAESWDGTAWSVMPTPDPSASADILYATSCLSASDCTAVGLEGAGASGGVEGTLIESWNGTAWSVVPSPGSGTRGSALYAVSCGSASSCTAAGWRTSSTGQERTLAEAGN